MATLIDSDPNVFILTKSLPVFGEPIYGLELLKAIESTTGLTGKILCVQKISGLWRITLSNELARATLLTTGVSLRGHFVPVLGSNPFFLNGKETIRLSISNFPFAGSSSLEVIQRELETLNVNMTSKLQYNMYRDTNNKLTNCSNGKMFVYIIAPETPLPKFIKVDRHKVFLSYLGQDEALNAKEIEQSKENSNDQSQRPVPPNPFEKPVEKQVNSINEHDIPSECSDLPDQHRTSTVPSTLTCAAETGLLEDTPEPLPLSDNSSFDKPIAFNIPLSKTPGNKTRKKSTFKILKKNQPTLHDLDKRGRKSYKTPSRSSRNSSTKRVFSERESPSHNANTGSKQKASRTVTEEHVSSGFSEKPA